mgnify:CR=1 FL=1
MWLPQRCRSPGRIFVMNGVHFRTRHNDYRLQTPAESTELDAVEDDLSRAATDYQFTLEQSSAVNEDINIVIQINGKKRSIINCKKGITEESLIKIIKEDTKIDKLLRNKRNIKSIFIKDRLINLIVKE